MNEGGIVGGARRELSSIGKRLELLGLAPGATQLVDLNQGWAGSTVAFELKVG